MTDQTPSDDQIEKLANKLEHQLGLPRIGNQVRAIGVDLAAARDRAVTAEADRGRLVERLREIRAALNQASPSAYVPLVKAPQAIAELAARLVAAEARVAALQTQLDKVIVLRDQMAAGLAEAARRGLYGFAVDAYTDTLNELNGILATAPAPAPEPATCEHGRTSRHLRVSTDQPPIDCPGPETCEQAEQQAADFIAAYRPHFDGAVEAAISGMADLDCDTAAGDTFNPDDYRAQAHAAVGAALEYLAWSGPVLSGSTPEPKETRNG